MLWKEYFQFCGKNVSNWKDSFQLKNGGILSQCGFSHWHNTCFYVGEAKKVLEAQLFCRLQDQDREIVDLLLDELKPKEIAEMILSTSEAVQMVQVQPNAIVWIETVSECQKTTFS